MYEEKGRQVSFTQMSYMSIKLKFKIIYIIWEKLGQIGKIGISWEIWRIVDNIVY